MPLSEKKCATCRTDFKPSTSSRKYCSVHCQQQGLKTGSYKKCLFCENPFYVRRGGLLIIKFCSNVCYGKYETEIKKFQGSNHPHWKGGVTHLEINRRRRIRELNAIGSHTQAEWLALKIKFGFMCLWCKEKEPSIKLTRDHIIPLTKSGSDSIDNIQPLCQPCNSRKYNKIINFALVA